MFSFKNIMLFSLFLLISSCATTHQNLKSKKQNDQSLQETRSALKAITGSLSGQTMDDQKMKRVAEQIQKDPEAQSAVKTITDSMRSEKVKVKFCPVDGERFSPKMNFCPVHKVELKTIND